MASQGILLTTPSTIAVTVAWPQLHQTTNDRAKWHLCNGEHGLILVITSGNALLTLMIWAFALTRNFCTTTNYFVISLAFTDLMVGVLSLPIFTIAIHNPMWTEQNPEVKQMWIAADMITSITSIVNLMYISNNYYLCMKYPLRVWVVNTISDLCILFRVTIYRMNWQVIVECNAYAVVNSTGLGIKPTLRDSGSALYQLS